MKYRITPFNIIFLPLFCYGVYFLTSSDTLGWGVFFGLIFTGSSLFILAIDYVAQYLKINYKRTVTIQSFLLAFIILLNYKDIIGPGSKNFVIPPSFSGHINIIYEVSGSPELPKPSCILSNQQNIIVPVSGIVLTSSKVSDTYPSTSYELSNKKKNDSLELNTITFDTLVIKNTVHPLETYTVTKKPFWINPQVDAQEKKHLRKLILNTSSSANNTFTASGL